MAMSMSCWPTDFYPRPPRGGRPKLVCARFRGLTFLSTPSARRATGQALLFTRPRRNFYPRPPRGGRPCHGNLFILVAVISIHALREEGDLCSFALTLWRTDFYPRPPRGGRLVGKLLLLTFCEFLSTPSARRATFKQFRVFQQHIQFLSTPSARRATQYGFLYNGIIWISIHALREEGDSKNGEKHLRFCFIIKRSAQIWKSLSKNIRKKSRDLHRTA